MTKTLPLVAIVTLLLAGCGGDERTARTTTTTGAPLTVVAYFYKGDRLAPVAVRVPRTGGVANAALQALLDGPPEGYTTAFPQGLEARVTEVGDDGKATVDTSARLERRAEAQLVYTLTRVPGVTAVEGAGARARYEEFVPPILVESPLPEARVSTPVQVRGTASVFEATLVVELVQNGTVVVKKTVTAAEGAPYRGAFDAALPGGDAGPATIVAFAPNAAGGPPQHRVDVPIRITP